MRISSRVRLVHLYPLIRADNKTEGKRKHLLKTKGIKLAPKSEKAARSGKTKKV
jgi:hypothetical protein